MGKRPLCANARITLIPTEKLNTYIATAARGMDIPRAAAYFIELPQWDLGKLSGGSAVRIGQPFKLFNFSNC